jgi:hypothetical protein
MMKKAMLDEQVQRLLAHRLISAVAEAHHDPGLTCSAAVDILDFGGTLIFWRRTCGTEIRHIKACIASLG